MKIGGKKRTRGEKEEDMHNKKKQQVFVDILTSCT